MLRLNVLLVVMLFINLPIVSAIEISGVSVKDLTDNSATIIWETDEAADSFVSYGEEKDKLQTIGDAKKVKSHALQVAGLEAQTKYLYSVESKDKKDDNGGSLEYITTYGSTGTDEDEFFNLQCAAAGIKETDGHNLSDVLFIEEWSDENGLVGFQVGADVVDFYTYPHKVTPEDEDQIVDIYFKVTGPIHINSMDILDDNARSVGFIWNDQTVNWVADDNYPNSGEKHIVAEFEKGFNIYGNYHFNINYDSWAEKFP